MPRDDDRELQDREQWEGTETWIEEPVENPRAIVPVAFSGDDFGAVAEHAKRSGMTITEFIREAARARTRVGHERETPVPVSARS